MKTISPYRRLVPIVGLCAVWAAFFYKTLFFGLLPFPGDLLVSSYQPWKSYSYIGYNPGSYPTKFQYFDVIRQLYPWRSFAMEQVKEGVMPLWNPYNFSGHPLFANIQSAVLYPLNIVYFFFSDEIAWSVEVMLQPLIASIGMYMFIRLLRVSNRGAIISSVAYGYSLFMTVFLEYNTIGHVVALLPWMLFLVEYSAIKFRWWICVLLSCLVSFGIFAGHIQVWFWSAVFTMGYILFRFAVVTQNYRRLLVVTLFFVTGVGLSFVQLIPAIELIRLSARVPHEAGYLADNLLLQFRQLALFLIPELYGNPATNTYMLKDSYPGNALYTGVVTFLFAYIGLFTHKKNTYVSFFVTALCIALLLTVRSPISIWLYTHVPFFSGSSPGNMLFLISFSVSCLAGFGVDYWMSQSRLSVRRFVIIISAAIVLVVAYAVVNNPLYGKSLVYSGGLLIVAISLMTGIRWTSRKNVRYVYVSALILILCVDMWYVFHKFNPFVPRELIYPDAPVVNEVRRMAGLNRFTSVDAASIEANFSTQSRLYDPQGYDPLYPSYYGQLIHASGNGKLLESFTSRTRSDAVFTSDANRQRLMNLTGVAYVVDRVENASSEETFPPSIFEQVYNTDGWKIFLNKQSLPRAYIAHSYSITESKESFETAFFSEHDERHAFVQEQADTDSVVMPCETSSAEIVSYRSQTVTVKTDAPCDGLLVLSDMYYPGWHVTVDDTSLMMLRTNWAFRGVAVPHGVHTVTFTYEPTSFFIGIIGSVVSSMILGGMAWLCVRMSVRGTI